MRVPPSNFAQLEAADAGLLRLELLAERYFPDDPNTALLKLRQFAERLAQQVAARIGLYTSAEEPQYDLIRRLREHGILTAEVARLFGEVRRAGNAASHAMTGDHRGALAVLKIAWQLGVWFQRTFKDPAYRPGPFIPPRAPAAEPGSGDELSAKLERLAAELAHFRTVNREVADQRDAAQAELRDAREEQVFWEQLAAEAEGAKVALAGQLAALQAQAAAAPPATVAAYVTAANDAAEAVELDEAATRRLIDEQLREAGWTVDSASLRHGQGARPQKGRNLAIAEWPTESGPADYALFYGLMPLATVEAKRRLANIPGALQQAKRTSRGFKPSPETLLPPTNYGAAGEYRVPFAFSTNGRPYLRQIETRSGIWFDAVKIGLTATPALHTTQIFGPPIFTYGYREAVIDGYLVDHEPPVQIRTELSAQGIRWRVGEEVQVYDRQSQQIATYTTPDELHFEVDAFNRQVLTESFNRVVCDYLARELDPASRHKTLIFCATDAHADLVVHLLKEAFRQHYGSITDDAVIKITGAADRPLQLIRRYRNERDPNSPPNWCRSPTTRPAPWCATSSSPSSSANSAT